MPERIQQKTMTLSLLSTGYWHARFSANQFIQWPQDRPPRPEDGFGWLTPEHFAQAERSAIEEHP